MNEQLTKKSNFISFDYKDVTVKKNMMHLYPDNFENFGWILEDSYPAVGSGNEMTLKFKRDRKIKNKSELARLQRQFETIIQEINALEASKIFKGAAVAYIIGVIGTAFMAGSVFAITSTPSHVLLSVVFAIPGFLGWILPYLVFRKLSNKKIIEVTPKIDQKYDELYEACEKANHLSQY